MACTSGHEPCGSIGLTWLNGSPVSERLPRAKLDCASAQAAYKLLGPDGRERMEQMPGLAECGLGSVGKNDGQRRMTTIKRIDAQTLTLECTHAEDADVWQEWFERFTKSGGDLLTKATAAQVSQLEARIAHLERVKRASRDQELVAAASAMHARLRGCAVKKPWFQSRGDSVVFVDQSTQAILPRDSAHCQRRHRGLAARRPLVQPPGVAVSLVRKLGTRPAG